MGRTLIPLFERLNKRIQKTSGCWYWTGKIDKTGYGSFGLKDNGVSRTRTAHKIVYEVLVGEVPQGMQLDHLCRNRLCVNPLHLEIVTPRENTLRSNAISAINARKTHCLNGHEFTESNTYRPPQFPRKRFCKICRNKSARKYQNNMKKRGK